MGNRFSFPSTTDLGYLDDPPVVRFWNGLLTDCLKTRTERLHVAPPHQGASTFSVRAYRAGAWTQYFDPPASMYPASIHRLKVMAGFKLSKRLPEEFGSIPVKQDGAAPLEIKVTVRVNPAGADEALIEFPVAPE